MQVVRAVQTEHFDRIMITLLVADTSTVSLDLADEYEGHKVEAGQDGTEG